MVIAIDGYSSCGKSSFAKLIAKELNFLYIDSGSMYRAVTLYALQESFISNEDFDETGLITALDSISIDFAMDDNTGLNRIFLNGKDVEKEIRQMKVNDNVSKVSKLPEIRKKMVKLQRSLSKNRDVVMDGRDIGTVVFPGADLKIFMTADPLIRAKRRVKELHDSGLDISFEEVERNIRERDRIDETREESPLKKADDAYVLDNSHMIFEEQMQWFSEIMKTIQR